jgi:hypothetical protein
MDTAAHALWAALAADQVARRYGSAALSGGSHSEFVAACVAFSLAPDFCYHLPFLAFYATKMGGPEVQAQDFRSDMSNIFYLRLGAEKAPPAWILRVLFLSHSFLFLGVAFAVLRWLWPALALPFLIGWGSHLVADLISHSDHFSLKPLYPLWGRAVPGFVCWYHSRRFNVMNYVTLVVVAVALYGRIMWR